MKVVIHIANRIIAERIEKVIHKKAPSAKVDKLESVTECYNRGPSYDYAFIGENNEGLPWDELSLHLTSKGVKVFFITREINRSTIKMVDKAQALSSISYEHIEEDIESLFIGISDSDISKADDEADSTAVNNADSQMTFQQFSILKSEKYPAVIVSIHGAKGGVGKTIVAASTAVMLAKEGLKVVVFDLDVENGNLGKVLGISNDKDIKSIIKGNHTISEDFYDIHPSGLYVLPGLKTPAESEVITAEVTERIIGRLARAFDVVIIDTGSIEIDPMLVAMQVSSRCYLISNCDLTAMSRTYERVEDAKAIGIDMGKVRLVANRVPKKLPYKFSIVNEHIDLPLLTKIPENENVLWAVNNGVIPVEERNCDSFTKGIAAIAKDIMSFPEIGRKLQEMKEANPAANKGKKKKGLF